MHMCAYHDVVDDAGDEYEWDPRKADSNLRKHGVDFADAVAVLEDDHALTIPDDVAEEERFVTTGMDTLGRVLVVAHAWSRARIRLISARKATPQERAYYEGRRR